VALSDCDDIGALFSFGMAESRTHAAALALEAGEPGVSIVYAVHFD
jgi:hypothetical protein